MDKNLFQKNIVPNTRVLVKIFLKIFYFIEIFIFLYPANFLPAQENSSKIVFLHFKMEVNTIRLVDYSINDGILKSDRMNISKQEDILYELVSVENKLLYKGTLENPLSLRYEYEDEDENNPGQLKLKIIELKEADFVLRFPYDKEIEAIVFYKTEKIESNNIEYKRTYKKLNRIILNMIVNDDKKKK
jgi:hypothetical protein